MKIYNKQQQQQQEEKKNSPSIVVFLLFNLSLMLPYPISYPWITGDE